LRESFEKAVAFTLHWEGDYSKDDGGGETKWGIARKMHPRITDKDWKNFTKQDAVLMYYNDYWEEINCDQFEFPYDCYVFDCAINLGVGFTKGALGTYGSGQLNEARRQHYLERAKENPKLQKYIRGWLLRVADLEKTFPVKEVKPLNTSPVGLAIAGLKILSPFHNTRDAYRDAAANPEAQVPPYLDAKFLGSLVTLITTAATIAGIQIPPEAQKVIDQVIQALIDNGANIAKGIGACWGISLIISHFVFNTINQAKDSGGPKE